MTIEIRKSCPLGHQCQTVHDGYIDECEWFEPIMGEHPQTGEQINSKKCAIPAALIFLSDIGRGVRGHSSAIESFRNEMIADNQKYLEQK
jgi:hypothetical protein